jgi:hypothetical protein
MSASGANPVVPTFTGFVQNSMDGLILFEACLSGVRKSVEHSLSFYAYKYSLHGTF